MEVLEVKAYVVKMICVLCLKYFRNEAKKPYLLNLLNIEVGSVALQIEIIKTALKINSTPLLKTI